MSANTLKVNLPERMVIVDARKRRILSAVVDLYIRTGEPVGSKTISQLPDIHVSAATVRNDMAVLEELGYLEQPHTSAGRVPTFNGYRMYIEEISAEGTLPQEERDRLDEMLGDESQLTEDLILQSATTDHQVCHRGFQLRTEIFGDLESGRNPYRETHVCGAADHIGRQDQESCLPVTV